LLIWAGQLDVSAAMAASAWDCLPGLAFDRYAARAGARPLAGGGLG